MSAPDSNKPFRGRRINWAEFTRLTGRPKPDYAARAANDNAPAIRRAA
jgi:hypothetical protein